MPDSKSTAPHLTGTLPWTRSCFVCGQDNPHGLRLKSRMEDGMVVLDYTTRERDLGWRHSVHGGITMTLLDEVMTWAAILSARRACVAAEVTTRLKRPIDMGVTLRVEGRVTTARPRLHLTEGRVLNPEGTVLATASGKYVPMPAGQYALCEDDFITDPASIAPGRLMESCIGRM